LRGRLYVGSDALQQAGKYLAGLSPLRTPVGVEPPGVGGDYTNYLSADSYTASELQGLMKRDFGIVVVGRLEYEDLSGLFYENDFCQGRLANGAIAACPVLETIRLGRLREQQNQP
jgi:hypothetical protein